MAAWVKRLDDKELICFFCHNLFLYFDPMSKMAVWKERLGGTGFRSADQPEPWVLDGDWYRLQIEKLSLSVGDGY